MATAVAAVAFLTWSAGPLPTDTANGYPLSPHRRVGVYMTSYAMRDAERLDAALAACASGRLNALVINVKNMHGEITYPSQIVAARNIGAVAGRIDLAALVDLLHARGVYVIARQVLFYDPVLARAIGTQGPWVDPTDPRVVEYNLRVASEVAALGVDELQFDYVRFPDDAPIGGEHSARAEAIASFLDAAWRRLAGAVHLSVDVFGRVLWPWNARGTDPIGQILEEIAARVNLVSPMVYPSHYSERKYVDDPYLVVTEGLASGAKRVETPLRPFLQAFERAIPRGMTLADYIRAQIRAAQSGGADGYLFWHASCDYATLYNVLERLPASFPKAKTAAL